MNGFPPGVGIVSIAAGRWHALAVGNNGQAYAWGLGSSGQLGNGTTTFSRYVPVTVSNLTNVAAVAAGQYHSIARTSLGAVWAWGSNRYGQVGDSTTLQRNAPVQIPSLSGSLAIASGLNHNLAVTINHTVAVWGYNANGQLGDTSTTNRTTPIILPNFTGIVQVAAGYAHSLALKDDGTVWAWGRNVEGQLGDASNTQRNAPVQVLGLSGIVAIAACDYHNLALKADGGVASWGANNLDQLGTGLSTAQLNPLIVPGINVLHGVSEVTIQQPAPDTYAVGEPFTLQLTLTPAAGRSIASIAYFSDGFPLALAGTPVTFQENIYPPVTTPTSRLAELSSDTWGDLHITATAYDEDNTPSFPSQPVTVRIFPSITVTGTPALDNSIRLTWSAILPNLATTYKVERRLSDETSAVVLQSALSGTNYLDARLALNQQYLYRVTGFKNGLRTAMSAEVAVTILDSDGDGLPDWWEQAWNLNPHAAGDATATLGGVGPTATKLYASHAMPQSVPQAMPPPGSAPPASQWVWRLPLWQTSEYDIAANSLGSHLTWDGEITPGATVTIERERLYGQWIALRTVSADARYAYVLDTEGEDPLYWQHVWSGLGRPRNERPNFRLRGAYTSNESVSRVRVMGRLAKVERSQPGIAEFEGPWFPPSTPPARKYYKKAHWVETSSSEWETSSMSGWSTWTETIDSNIDVASNTYTRIGNTSYSVETTSVESEGTSSWGHSGGTDESPSGTWPPPMGGSGSGTAESSEWYSSWDSPASGDGSSFSSGSSAIGSTSGPYEIRTASDGFSEYWGFNWSGTITTTPASGPSVTEPWGTPSAPGAPAASTATGPLNMYRSSDGQTWTAEISEEYAAVDFFDDTALRLLAPPAAPGRKVLGTDSPELSNNMLYHGEMPERVSGNDYHVGSELGWGILRTVETTGCYWWPDLHRLELKRSDWWLEANDCLAGEVVTVVETEQAYTGIGRNLDNQKTIKNIVSITPGSDPGQKVTSQVIHSDVTGTMVNRTRYLARLPSTIRVDANRDGVIDENDITSTEHPFRFWVNDDRDHGENDDDLSGAVNHSDSIINGIRDLEDVIQVKFSIPQILIDMAKAGTAQLGLKWKNVSQGSPSVRIWSGSPNIDQPDYLKDRGIAFQTVGQNNFLVGIAPLVTGTTSVWLRSSLMNDATNATVNLLMEGVSVGVGKLIFVIKIGTQESEGPSMTSSCSTFVRCMSAGGSLSMRPVFQTLGTIQIHRP